MISSMKKLYFIQLSIIVIFTVTSCSKYEEGPLISLKPKKHRLDGTWKVIEFKKDYEDLTQFYQDSCGCDIWFNDPWDEQLIFITNCLYNGWHYGDPSIYSFRSRWSFSKDKKRIWTRLGHNTDTQYRLGMYPLTLCQICWSSLEILRLTDDDFWVRYEDFNNIYTIKFEKK
jgi:hypothetical protein